MNLQITRFKMKFEFQLTTV